MKLTGTHIIGMTLAQLAQRALPALAALALAPALLSCTKQASAPAVLTDADAITISEPAFEGEDTKGVASTDYSYIQANGFEMGACFISTGDWSVINPGTHVSMDSGGKWVIPGSPRWPSSGKLSFFFYSPQTSGSFGFQKGDAGSMPGLNYAPSTTDIANQIDICVGVPQMNRSKSDGKVPVSFFHALTQIVFSAKYSGTLGTGEFVMIDTIKVKNVVGSNTGNWNVASPYFVWNTSSTTKATYVLSRSGGLLETKKLTTSDDLVTTANGTMYLLPQTFTAPVSSQIEISYGVYTGTVASPTKQRSYKNSVYVPAGSWVMGKQMNYNITINLPDVPTGEATLTLSGVIKTWQTDVGNWVVSNRPPVHIE